MTSRQKVSLAKFISKKIKKSVIFNQTCEYWSIQTKGPIRVTCSTDYWLLDPKYQVFETLFPPVIVHNIMTYWKIKSEAVNYYAGPAMFLWDRFCK